MKFKRLKREYHDKLIADTEFECNPRRPYYVIRQLDYKGTKIDVAIPLRSNINPNFSSKPDEYVATPPTSHTLIGKGNIAGWHITKLIPVKADKIVSRKIKSGSDTDIAYMIADAQKAKLISSAQKMLNNFESGTTIFGAINFDEAIKKLDE